MKHMDIRHLLQQVDEPTALRLSERHPGLTDADKERLFQRIEQNLADPVELPVTSAPEEKPQISRFENLHGIAAAAACFAVCAATVAGMFWLKSHQPPVSDPDRNAAQEHETAAGTEILSTDVPGLAEAPVYEIGEPCPASHLSASGTVMVTVQNAVSAEDGRCAVTVTLESRDAVAWDGGRTFLLDNLLLETENGLLSPCGTDYSSTGDYPYAVTLPDGASETITIYYHTAGHTPIVLHTGADRTMPCIRLHEGE